MIGDETRASAKAEQEYELHHHDPRTGTWGDRHEIRTCLHTLGVESASLHQLPTEITHFTGRSVELEKAIAILQAQGEGDPTLLTVSGTAGVGKSAFAIHVAHCIKHDLSEIQFYANLRGTENQPLEPQEVLSSFLQALGVGYPMASASLAEQQSIYQLMLSGRRVLMVLDNARDAAQVQPLLPDSPTCTAIVTSRQRLELPGTTLELEPLPPAEALELLQKVGHVSPELTAAEQLVTLCGRLPLALKITGGTLCNQAQPPENYADRLADERQKLEQLQSSYLDVRASFAVSYAQQEKAIARLLRLIGLLVRPNLTAAIVAALLECDLEAANKILSALVRSGLLEPAEPSCFRLHDLIRLFAKEQLARGESAEMRRIVRLRASYWYCETAGLLALAFDLTDESLVPLEKQAFSQGDDELLRTVLSWFDREKLNLLAALEWANQTQAWETVVKLAQSLTRWFELRHDWKNWEQTHRLALEASRKLSDRPAEAQILNSLGNAYFRQDHRKKAREHYEKSLNLLRELGDRYQESQTLTNLGLLYKREGDDEKAIALWQTALKGFPTNSAAARQLEFWLQSSQKIALDEMQPDMEVGDRSPRLAIQQIIAGCAIGAIALLVVLVLLIRSF
ncbi:tetratricopeptide repeat protein [Cyanobacteria bacterium FACHB-471]|nr:tetratricopeptide repeat protein [Cyanobacteria bacterium FACHB-471]